jgi:hypothetical protein
MDESLFMYEDLYRETFLVIHVSENVLWKIRFGYTVGFQIITGSFSPVVMWKCSISWHLASYL